MEHNDAASAYGENAAAIAEELTAAAVSRLRAAALDAPVTYPRQLRWHGTNFGLFIESEHNSYLVQPTSPIRPAEVLQRLIHPGFNAGIAGSC